MQTITHIRYLEKNYTANAYNSKFCIYFAMIAIALTTAPFDFQHEELQSFTWHYQSFDLFINLFLLSPIGFS
jgi:uncharacterized membrane protein YadS